MSDVDGTKIDEAFIGSCMTNIGHFSAAVKLLCGRRDIPVKPWVAPPPKMDSELIKEGHYANFGAAGARIEMPGCSLCGVSTGRRKPVASPLGSCEPSICTRPHGLKRLETASVRVVTKLHEDTVIAKTCNMPHDSKRIQVSRERF